MSAAVVGKRAARGVRECERRAQQIRSALHRSLNQSTASSNISSAECAVLRFKVLSKAEIRPRARRNWQGSRIVVVVLSEEKSVRQTFPVMPCEAQKRDCDRLIQRRRKSLTRLGGRESSIRVRFGQPPCRRIHPLIRRGHHSRRYAPGVGSAGAFASPNDKISQRSPFSPAKRER